MDHFILAVNSFADTRCHRSANPTSESAQTGPLWPTYSTCDSTSDSASKIVCSNSHEPIGNLTGLRRSRFSLKSISPLFKVVFPVLDGISSNCSRREYHCFVLLSQSSTSVSDNLINDGAIIFCICHVIKASVEPVYKRLLSLVKTRPATKGSRIALHARPSNLVSNNFIHY